MTNEVIMQLHAFAEILGKSLRWLIKLHQQQYLAGEYTFVLEQRNIFDSDIKKKKKTDTDINYLSFMAFERFVARRGHCNRLYSDNNTNLSGAYKEIRAAYKDWRAPYSQDLINKKGTDWIFMKPTASHQGAIYEAAVKSAKHHLYRLLGNVHYSYEHLTTFLTKIEAYTQFSTSICAHR